MTDTKQSLTEKIVTDLFEKYPEQMTKLADHAEKATKKIESLTQEQKDAMASTVGYLVTARILRNYAARGLRTAYPQLSKRDSRRLMHGISGTIMYSVASFMAARRLVSEHHAKLRASEASKKIKLGPQG